MTNDRELIRQTLIEYTSDYCRRWHDGDLEDGLEAVDLLTDRLLAALDGRLLTPLPEWVEEVVVYGMGEPYYHDAGAIEWQRYEEVLRIHLAAPEGADDDDAE